MKAAVVFYSLDGNCSLVAQELKTLINADLIQLQTLDEKKRSFLGKMLRGGGMVVMGKKPPLKPYTFDPAEYDLLVIGVPVWAGSPAPPIKTFLSGAGISGKKIAIFVCHAGGMRGALDKLKSLLPENEIVAEANFVNPSKNRGEAKRQIADWVKKL